MPCVNDSMGPLCVQVFIPSQEFKIVPYYQVSQAVHIGVNIAMKHAVESLNQYFHEMILVDCIRSWIYYWFILNSITGNAFSSMTVVMAVTAAFRQSFFKFLGRSFLSAPPQPHPLCYGWTKFWILIWKVGPLSVKAKRVCQDVEISY